MINEDNKQITESMLYRIFTDNIIKEMDSFSSHEDFYKCIISHFDKVFNMQGLLLIIFTINKYLDLSIPMTSKTCSTEIIHEIFYQLDKKQLGNMFYSHFNHLSINLGNKQSFHIKKLLTDKEESILLGIYSLKAYNQSSDFINFLESLEVIKTKFQVHKKMISLTKSNEELQERLNLLNVTNKINDFLIKSMDENDIYSILLLGITAGQGLGFNRAFIFTLNEAKDCLNGIRALGPIDPFEAHNIWEKVDKQFLSFADILNTFRSSDIHETRSNKLIKRININITPKENNPFASILDYERPSFIQFTDPFYKYAKEFFDIMNIGSFIAYPIKTYQNIFGIIIADNKFTNKIPLKDEVLLFQTIISQGSNIIQNIRLYDKLSQKLDNLRANQKKLDENREKLSRAEKFSFAGELLEKLSHTLKNPLVSIGGFARNLQKPQISDKKRSQYASILLKEVQRIENILEDVCNISSETSPALQMEDINNTIIEAANMLKSETEKEKARINLNLNNLLPNIMIDKHQITQVIVNIIRNGFYAANRKQIKAIIHIDSKKSGEFIVLSISDNGIGIPEKDIDKLFNAFFSTKEIGTGLGLTISSQIIKNHKGYLTVKSQPGKGSTFYIHLPIER